MYIFISHHGNSCFYLLLLLNNCIHYWDTRKAGGLVFFNVLYNFTWLKLTLVYSDYFYTVTRVPSVDY